jgi:Domain of unknown function (DUF1707)
VAGEIDPRNLLVSDAEREHVGGLLQRAVGQGRLTLGEFESRMSAAMAARTRADLNALVLDIAEANVRPAKNQLELRTGVGEIKRRGRWMVPPVIKVDSGIGGAKLDFTEAQFASAETTIDVKLGVGELLMIVPRGASVDYDDLHTGMGGIKDRLGPPEPGGQRFVVRGQTGVGEVKLVHQRWRRIWPLWIRSYPFRMGFRRS